MSEIVIRAESLGKQYRIGTPERYRALRDTLTDGLFAPFRLLGSLAGKSNGSSNGSARTAASGLAAPNSTIWALRDVSFEVRRGEAVGLIGRNGAGKTTLLKVLSQITLPTRGRAEVHGRVGSLLEVGTGFHPELTGRENAYLSGAILGMSKREMERKFDEIVAFSGVERFLDTPLKHYSSGMQMRLAFAVAAHLEPEILLVDEVLAVGDIEFQKKCLGKMEEVTRQGRTVLFVSHNMGALRRLCTRGLWLDAGGVRQSGSAGECVDAYVASVESAAREETGCFDLAARTDRHGDRRVQMTRIRFRGADGGQRSRFEFAEPFAIEFEIEARDTVRSCFVGVTILAADGTNVIGTHHCDTAELRDFVRGHSYRLSCLFEPNTLKPGLYALQVGLLDFATWDVYDWFYSVGQFAVTDGTGKYGRVSDDRPAFVHPVLQWEWK